MMKAIISFIGFISAINASKRLLQQTCNGENEEYSLCGSACPDVCGVDPPDACITVCVEGCFCAEGYIRNTNGDCISENACKYGCGANEVYSPCNGHCRPTCETGPIIACTRQCEPGCNCAPGYILDVEDGTCIPDDQCLADTCPLRCESGFDGCNQCFCDGLGNTGGCTKRGCPAGTLSPAGCSKCEIGYTLNTVTNTCDSAKVSCNNHGDCDSRIGFVCRKDPECREYSDEECYYTGKVCVSPKALEDVCNGDNDCDTGNGFGCLDGPGDIDGICVKYQSS